MTIDLYDIRDAVDVYFDTKVKVTITISPAAGEGNTLNSDEDFTIEIAVQNAPAPPGKRGIILTDIRYHIRVDDPMVAKLRVPPSSLFRTTNSLGQVLQEDALVEEMNVVPIINWVIPAGDTAALPGIGGRTESVVIGRAITVHASVDASIQTNSLFFKRPVGIVTKTLEVVD